MKYVIFCPNRGYYHSENDVSVTYAPTKEEALQLGSLQEVEKIMTQGWFPRDAEAEESGD